MMDVKTDARTAEQRVVQMESIQAELSDGTMAESMAALMDVTTVVKRVAAMVAM